MLKADRKEKVSSIRKEMQSCSNAVCSFLVFLILETVIVHGEPEPMARPTRPEVITSPEELRKYLDHVSDYYSLNGKARYGKRGNVLSSTSDINDVWDTMKTILENSQRLQRPRFGERKQEESRSVGELGSYGAKKDTSRIDARPCHTLNIVERYYDTVQ